MERKQRREGLGICDGCGRDLADNQGSGLCWECSGGTSHMRGEKSLRPEIVGDMRDLREDEGWPYPDWDLPPPETRKKRY